MDNIYFLQWLAFGANMVFIVLLTLNRKLAWPFGIFAAALSGYIFYQSHYVSEAFLQIFYIIMGVYGWIYWSKGTKGASKPIVEYSKGAHLILISGSVGLALLMGKLNQINEYAAVPYADAFSTAFAFTATFLEARKVLSGWIYWIAINIYSIWLYGQKVGNEHDLQILQIQMGVFALFSIIGFIAWKKKWNGKISPMTKLAPGE